MAEKRPERSVFEGRAAQPLVRDKDLASSAIAMASDQFHPSSVWGSTQPVLEQVNTASVVSSQGVWNSSSVTSSSNIEPAVAVHTQKGKSGRGRGKPIKVNTTEDFFGPG